MSMETTKVAKSYSWQCLECKTCTICEDPGEEVGILYLQIQWPMYTKAEVCKYPFETHYTDLVLFKIVANY